MAFAESVALWAAGAEDASSVVSAACDALVAGENSGPLAVVAGLPPGASSFDLEDGLEEAMADLGLPYAPPRTFEARVAGARVMASRCIGGRLAPRELVRWMHATFRHGQDRELEPFLVLDDEYDIVEDTGRNVDALDREVVAEARRLSEP